jgi:hypothetical protein
VAWWYWASGQAWGKFSLVGQTLDCGGFCWYGRTAGVQPNKAPPPHGEMPVYGSFSSGRELQYVGR